MVEIRPVESREELRRVFDIVGGEVIPRIDTSDFRFRDLDSHFPADRPLMVVAVAGGRPVGGALAFRNDNGVATLRMIAVVDAFRTAGSADVSSSVWKPRPDSLLSRVWE